MARPRKKKTEVDHLLFDDEPKTEWQKALVHLEENYKLYIAGAVFLVICIALGAFIKGMTVIKEREKNTLYAEAALVEDPLERLIKYEEVVDSVGKWTPEALYRMGETAIQAESYDKAEEAFNKLVADYPDSEFVPDAVDGLAFLAWNKGDLEGALKGYQQVAQDWPGEFVGRRVHYDIGRVLEEMEQLEDAIAAYKKQVAVFPDSAVARKSQQALDALKEEHPDLFPEEEEDAEVSEEEASEEETAEEETAEEETAEEETAEEETAEEETAVATTDETAENATVTSEAVTAAEGETPETLAPAEEVVVEGEVPDTPASVEETVETVGISSESSEAVAEPAEVTEEAPVVEVTEVPTEDAQEETASEESGAAESNGAESPAEASETDGAQATTATP